MKAIVIDPDERSINYVERDFADFKEIQKEIFCSCFTVAGYLNGHAVYCDDEGMMNMNLVYTKMSHYPYPLAGRIVLLKATDDGDSDDATMTLEEVKNEIQFLTVFQVKKQYARG